MRTGTAVLARLAMSAAILLGAARVRAEIVRTPEAAGKSGGRDVLSSAVVCRFRDAHVECRLSRAPGGAFREALPFLSGSIGRFTYGFLGFAPRGGGSFREPERSWAAAGPAGTELAELALPLHRGDVRTGLLSIRMATLPDRPGWVFFRLSGDRAAMPSRLTAAARIQQGYVAHGAVPVRLACAWPGGVCPAGERPPWNGARPDFDALAFFVRGLGGETGSDFLLFDPAPVAAAGFQRFDDVAILYLDLAETPEYLLAFGHDGASPAEGAAVPGFLDAGRRAVAAALKSIRWDPAPVDRGPIEKLVAEAAGMLRVRPDAVLQREFDRLSAAARALGAGDHGGAEALTRDLGRLCETLAEKALAGGG